MFLEVFDNSRRSFRAKVGAAATRYYGQFKIYPNLVHVPPGEKPPRTRSVRVQVGHARVSVHVEEKEGLPARTLYIGFEPES